MRRLVFQFLRFSVVGVTAFGLDVGIMILLTEFAGLPYLASTTISYIISLVYNYFFSMKFVFKHRYGLSFRREFTVFIILSLIGLLFNDALMYLGTSVLDFDYRVTKVVVGVIVSFWNFFSRKYFLDDDED